VAFLDFSSAACATRTRTLPLQMLDFCGKFLLQKKAQTCFGDLI
jgi:hypothetical protein